MKSRSLALYASIAFVAGTFSAIAAAFVSKSF